MSRDAETIANVLTALQTLTQAGLTYTDVQTLLDAPEHTREQVLAQLDATDAAIQQARGDN